MGCCLHYFTNDRPLEVEVANPENQPANNKISPILEQSDVFMTLPNQPLQPENSHQISKINENKEKQSRPRQNDKIIEISRVQIFIDNPQNNQASKNRKFSRKNEHKESILQIQEEDLNSSQYIRNHLTSLNNQRNSFALKRTQSFMHSQQYLGIDEEKAKPNQFDNLPVIIETESTILVTKIKISTKQHSLQSKEDGQTKEAFEEIQYSRIRELKGNEIKIVQSQIQDINNISAYDSIQFQGTNKSEVVNQYPPEEIKTKLLKISPNNQEMSVQI